MTNQSICREIKGKDRAICVLILQFHLAPAPVEPAKMCKRSAVSRKLARQDPWRLQSCLCCSNDLHDNGVRRGKLCCNSINCCSNQILGAVIRCLWIGILLSSRTVKWLWSDRNRLLPLEARISSQVSSCGSLDGGSGYSGVGQNFRTFPHSDIAGRYVCSHSSPWERQT
jgi:hypothetical protein